MKTALEWFKTLPEPYKAQAIENTPIEELDKKHFSLKGALFYSFVFNATEQGFIYWDEYVNSLADIEEQELLDKAIALIEAKLANEKQNLDVSDDLDCRYSQWSIHDYTTTILSNLLTEIKELK
jgi:hypothetical protein